MDSSQRPRSRSILGFHFLTGDRRGETALFITLEEDHYDRKANAAAFGFDTDAVEFLDLSTSADEFTEDGILVGDPLSGIRGILSGTPEIVEDRSKPTDSAAECDE